MISPIEDNAAVHYRKAADLLPKFSPAEQKVLAEVLHAPFEGALEDMVLRSDLALQEVSKGAKSKICQWGVDFTKDLFSGAGNKRLTALNHIGHLGCVQIRQAFEGDEAEAALEHFSALIIMARRVGRTGPLFPKLIEMAIEVRAVEAGAIYLPGQTKSTLKALESLTERLAVSGNLKEAMQGEREFFCLVEKDKYQANTFEESMQFLAKSGNKQLIQAIRACTGNSKEKLLALAEQMDEFYEKLGQIFMFFEPQFSIALNNFRTRHAANNPLISHLLQHAEGFHYVFQRSLIYDHMLKAGVAVLLYGPEKLQEYRDPADQGPYRFRQFNGGFEIHSKLAVPNRPAPALMFGRDKSLSTRIRRIGLATAKKLGLWG